MTAPLRQRLLVELYGENVVQMVPMPVGNLIRAFEMLASDEGAVDVMAASMDRHSSTKANSRAALAALARHVGEG